MPELKKAEFFDWSDIEAEVETNTGKDIRDWKGKFKSSNYDSNVEYCDFWHILCDNIDMHNGAIESIDFEDIRRYFCNDGEDEKTTPEWIDEVIDALQVVLGEGAHDIRFSW
jgi:hypothetical protein